ncbi:hypothetical protein [Saccharothrix syringae]|uniref:Uncharacterized protein n=1 Tax=Saccharothrix syringae TaxID=103733 RepID=A0A5Q0GZN9_SACSY|nr:hypothetical protein [Saccharothrix syringae]QFZ19024.1 hypothetical protein EKG83_17590 [Saccharothrix syringae]
MSSSSAVAGSTPRGVAGSVTRPSEKTVGTDSTSPCATGPRHRSVPSNAPQQPQPAPTRPGAASRPAR